MAVHAAVAGHLVGEDGCFLIVFQTTLVDAHLVPGLVARFYQPVGDVGVYLLFGDVEVERGVFFPFVSSLGLQADGDGRCGVYEPFPFGGTDGYLPLRVVTVVSSSPARYMARRREAWQLSGREKHGGAMFGGSVTSV